ALDAVKKEAANFQTAADRKLLGADPSVRKTCQMLAGLSRLGLVELAVTNPTSGLLAHLPSDAPVYGFSIAGDGVLPLPLARPGKQPVRRLLLEPTAPAPSDLAAAVRAALDELRGAVSVPAGVLFS